MNKYKLTKEQEAEYKEFVQDEVADAQREIREAESEKQRIIKNAKDRIRVALAPYGARLFQASKMVERYRREHRIPNFAYISTNYLVEEAHLRMKVGARPRKEQL